MIGAAIAAVGGVLLLAALLINGGLLEDDRSEGMSSLEAVGWFGLIIGVVVAGYGLGRAGPERQSSCCGCSCALLLLALPISTLALWEGIGPVAVIVAPVAFPLSLLALDGSVLAGRFVASIAHADPWLASSQGSGWSRH